MKLQNKIEQIKCIGVKNEIRLTRKEPQERNALNDLIDNQAVISLPTALDK